MEKKGRKLDFTYHFYQVPSIIIIIALLCTFLYMFFSFYALHYKITLPYHFTTTTKEKENCYFLFYDVFCLQLSSLERFCCFFFFLLNAVISKSEVTCLIRGILSISFFTSSSTTFFYFFVLKVQKSGHEKVCIFIRVFRC